jgi:predicted SprT family Zn-dependent metalloprotease
MGIAYLFFVVYNSGFNGETLMTTLQNLKDKSFVKIQECLDAYDLGHLEIRVKWVTGKRWAGRLKIVSEQVAWLELGICNIELGEDFLEDYGQEFIDNTVVHEAAHAIVRLVYPNAKQDHGPEFRAVMRGFGASTETKHDYKPRVDAKRHVYQCACQTHYVSTTKHNRIKSGRTYYRCKFCATVIFQQLVTVKGLLDIEEPEEYQHDRYGYAV